jgi:hypothetical protein
MLLKPFTVEIYLAKFFEQLNDYYYPIDDFKWFWLLFTLRLFE